MELFRSHLKSERWINNLREKLFRVYEEATSSNLGQPKHVAYVNLNTVLLVHTIHRLYGSRNAHIKLYNTIKKPKSKILMLNLSII